MSRTERKKDLERIKSKIKDLQNKDRGMIPITQVKGLLYELNSLKCDQEVLKNSYEELRELIEGR